MNSLFKSVRVTAQRHAQRRSFGSHAPREYEGAEAVVRKYLPEDHHVVLGCIGMYVGLYGLVKLVSGGSEPAAAAPAPVDAGASADATIPSLTDEAFEAWAKVPGNMEKWEGSIEEWANKL